MIGPYATVGPFTYLKNPQITKYEHGISRRDGAPASYLETTGKLEDRITLLNLLHTLRECDLIR